MSNQAIAWKHFSENGKSETIIPAGNYCIVLYPMGKGSSKRMHLEVYSGESTLTDKYIPKLKNIEVEDDSILNPRTETLIALIMMLEKESIDKSDNDDDFDFGIIIDVAGEVLSSAAESSADAAKKAGEVAGDVLEGIGDLF